MDRVFETTKRLLKSVPMWARVALGTLCTLCVFLLVLLLLTGARLEKSDNSTSLAHARIKGALQTEVNSLYRAYEKLSLDKYDNETEVMPEMRAFLYGISLLNTNIENCFSETVLPADALTAISSTLDTLDTLLDNKDDTAKAVSQLGKYLDKIREITG